LNKTIRYNLPPFSPSPLLKDDCFDVARHIAIENNTKPLIAQRIVTSRERKEENKGGVLVVGIFFGSAVGGKVMGPATPLRISRGN
jgi:hypothetical protein